MHLRWSNTECELCGKPLTEIRRSMIEGSVLAVCDRCASSGEDIVTVRAKKRPVDTVSIIDDSLFLESGFGKEVKALREAKALSQEELALKISERASIIKRIEHGFEPEEATVRKLEKFFGKRFHDAGPSRMPQKTGKKLPPLTLGDVAEMRKRA